MKDKLRDLIQEQFVDLVNQNVDGVATELQHNPEGKLTVAVSFKLVLAGFKMYSTGSIGYSRKYTDTVEGGVELEDPKQPKLKGV